MPSERSRNQVEPAAAALVSRPTPAKESLERDLATLIGANQVRLVPVAAVGDTGLLRQALEAGMPVVDRRLPALLPPSGSARPSWLLALPEPAGTGWMTVVARDHGPFTTPEIELVRASVRRLVEADPTALDEHRADAADWVGPFAA